jgi:two-component system, cell cycle sensor histidine kinase and response regulator CckA
MITESDWPGRRAHYFMRTVLAVDDEDFVISSISETLRDVRCLLITTTDPHQALGMIEAHHPIDLLITDLFMPSMDGATLLRKSRRIRPDLKIILMTGVASERQMRRWQARHEIVVTKPWFDGEFVDAVRRALGQEF